MKRALILTALALSLIIPGSVAHAQAGALGCAAAAVPIGAGAAAIGAVVPVADWITEKGVAAVEAKECIFDGLVVALREGLIAALTDSIVSWINNGFEGGPAFVTDLNGFLGEIADETAVDFILGEDLDFLCSPFELDVRIALAVERRPFQQNIRCSLSDVTDNAERFFAGDFSSGGWPAFFKISTDLQNNPYGAYFLAKAELDGREANAINEQLNKLSWGQGFFSKEKCTVYDSAGAVGADGGPKCLQSESVTPGAQINSYLSDSLYSGQRQLELADEIDEIINALLAQLARKAFTSLDGLTGLSSRSSSSAQDSRSYLEQLTSETSDHSVSVVQSALVTSIDTAIDREEEYQTALTSSIASMTAARGALANFYTCFIGTSPAGTAAASNLASSTITTTIGPALVRYQRELADSGDAVERLEAIRISIRTATTPAEINAAENLYNALARSGIMHTATEVATLQSEIAGTTGAIDTIATTLGDGSPQCASTL